MSRHIDGIVHLSKEHEIYQKNESQWKAIIIRNQGILYCFLLENGRIIKINREEKEAYPIGTVLVGKVTHVLKQTEGAFVRLDGKNTMAYLPLSEKELNCIKVCNRKPDGRILQNDDVIVQIKKEPQKTKPYLVSGILELKEDMQSNRYNDLRGQFEKIDSYGQNRTLYSVLYKPDVFYVEMIHGLSEHGNVEVVTDCVDVSEHLMSCGIPCRLYEDSRISLSKIYSFDTKIKELLSKKVYMKSGAYLVIEPTEALISIDVNSGKAQKNVDHETYSLLVNKEAAKEVAYQLMVRNLSGMILVDFINLNCKESKKELIATLSGEISKDKVTTRFVDMTRLGLAELTRKKTEKPLSYVLRDWK